MAATRRGGQSWRGRPPPARRRRKHPPRRNSVLTAAEVLEAAQGLRGVAVRTPLRYVSPPLDAWLKLENLQPVGAFKIRGAYNAVRRLPDAVRKRGGSTYSSG